MLSNDDLKGFLRDLVYVEENAYNLVDQTDLPEKLRMRVKDNIKEKQVILAKMISNIV